MIHAFVVLLENQYTIYPVIWEILEKYLKEDFK